MPRHCDHIVILSDDDETNENVGSRSAECSKKNFLTPVELLDSASDLCQEDLIDPCPDVHALFQDYNRKHFENRITHTYVEYSRRMTSCAGTCSFIRSGCRIALSEPLLKLRPVSDLKSTLLHEMIHAFLFLTQGTKRDGPDGHGPMFMHHADRINRSERGVDITPYHTFHEEVESYRVHHWRCDKCGRIIKRAMNRAPAPTDYWWPSHARNCIGRFVKIAGPPPKKPKSKRAPKFGAVAVEDKIGHKNINDGVIKTMRIDYLMNRRNKKKNTGSESMNCPMCDAKLDKNLLSKHLESCIPPELLSSQIDNVTIDNKELSLVGKDTSVKGHTSTSKKRLIAEAIEIPESPPCKSVRTTRSPHRGSTFISKHHENLANSAIEDIVDVDAPSAIATNPSGKTFSSVDKAAAPRLSAARGNETSSVVPDFQTVVTSLRQPEGPVDLEQKAISKLKEYLYDFNAEKPFSFYETAKILKMEQTKLLDTICKGSTVTKKGDIRMTTEAQELLFPPQSQDDIKRGVFRPGKIELSEHLKASNGSKQNSKSCPSLVIRRCPLCDRSIPTTAFEKHVSKCLEDSNITSVLMDKEDDADEEKSMRNKGCVENSVVRTNSATCSGAQKVHTNQETQRLIKCPICDIGKHRNELESHVELCLQTTGLLDAL